MAHHFKYKMKSVKSINLFKSLIQTIKVHDEEITEQIKSRKRSELKMLLHILA